MPLYRCYLLDRAGTIRDVEIVDCRSDQEVRTASAELLTSDAARRFSAVEVWDEGRMVLCQGKEAVVPST